MDRVAEEHDPSLVPRRRRDQALLGTQHDLLGAVDVCVAHVGREPAERCQLLLQQPGKLVLGRSLRAVPDDIHEQVRELRTDRHVTRHPGLTMLQDDAVDLLEPRQIHAEAGLADVPRCELLAKHVRPHGRTHPIGADHEIEAAAAAVLEARLDAVFRLLESTDRRPVIDPDADRERPLGQDPVQFRARDPIHRRQVQARDRRARHLADRLARLVQHPAPGLGRVALGEALLSAADRIKCPQRIDRLNDSHTVGG